MKNYNQFLNYIKCCLFLLLSLIYSSSNAQFVLAPKFGAYLFTYVNPAFPGLVTKPGSQYILNTTIAKQVVSLNIYNYDLDNINGVSYFTNLIMLDLDNNNLSNIANLPTSLRELQCQRNSIATLPTLPQSLIKLYCRNNPLLTSLPTLPNSVKEINCFENKLISLPVLPSSLEVLKCNSNALTSLPSTIPGSLKRLDCWNNPEIRTLPSLPTTLLELRCYKNGLTSLPNSLPSSLTVLECDQNYLTVLPNPLPSTLTQLSCTQNLLTALPPLNCPLTWLAFYKNDITSVPALPPTLQTMYCAFTKISSLPPLPGTLRFLKADNNPNLRCLPNLPNGLTFLEIQATGIKCLPNLPPAITGYPVCDPTQALPGNFVVPTPVCKGQDECISYSPSRLDGYFYTDNTNVQINGSNCIPTTALALGTYNVFYGYCGTGSPLQKTFTVGQFTNLKLISLPDNQPGILTKASNLTYTINSIGVSPVENTNTKRYKVEIAPAKVESLTGSLVPDWSRSLSYTDQEVSVPGPYGTRQVSLNNFASLMPDYQITSWFYRVNVYNIVSGSEAGVIFSSEVSSFRLGPSDNTVVVPSTHLTTNGGGTQNTDINWVYEVTFIEGGGTTESISYIDGLGKTRQIQSKLNTENKILCVETAYSEEGGGSAQSLPATIASTRFEYAKDFFDVACTNCPNGILMRDFATEDFDTQTKTLNSEVPAASTPLSSSRVANYYSSLNTTEPYIDDANGFPYSYTVSSQDGSGRAYKKTSPGATFQVGTPRTTDYMYTSASSSELKHVFGDIYGNSLKNVAKSIVKDANGTANYSYMDSEGRVIATAINSCNATSLKAVSQTGAVHTNVINVMEKDALDISQGIQTASEKFYLPCVGSGSNPKVLYKAALDPSYLCNDCKVQIDLDIVEDATGTNIYHVTHQVTPTQCSAINAAGTYLDLTSAVNPGFYTITRKISQLKDPVTGFSSADLYVRNQQAAMIANKNTSERATFDATYGVKEEWIMMRKAYTKVSPTVPDAVPPKPNYEIPTIPSGWDPSIMGFPLPPQLGNLINNCMTSGYSNSSCFREKWYLDDFKIEDPVNIGNLVTGLKASYYYYNGNCDGLNPRNNIDRSYYECTKDGRSSGLGYNTDYLPVPPNSNCDIKQNTKIYENSVSRIDFDNNNILPIEASSAISSILNVGTTVGNPLHNFAVVYEGFIKIDVPGYYGFYLKFTPDIVGNCIGNNVDCAVTNHYYDANQDFKYGFSGSGFRIYLGDKQNVPPVLVSNGWGLFRNYITTSWGNMIYYDKPGYYPIKVEYAVNWPSIWNVESHPPVVNPDGSIRIIQEKKNLLNSIRLYWGMLNEQFAEQVCYSAQTPLANSINYSVVPSSAFYRYPPAKVVTNLDGFFGGVNKEEYIVENVVPNNPPQPIIDQVKSLFINTYNSTYWKRLRPSDIVSFDLYTIEDTRGTSQIKDNPAVGAAPIKPIQIITDEKTVINPTSGSPPSPFYLFKVKYKTNDCDNNQCGIYTTQSSSNETTKCYNDCNETYNGLMVTAKNNYDKITQYTSFYYKQALVDHGMPAACFSGSTSLTQRNIADIIKTYPECFNKALSAIKKIEKLNPYDFGTNSVLLDNYKATFDMISVFDMTKCRSRCTSPAFVNQCDYCIADFNSCVQTNLSSLLTGVSYLIGTKWPKTNGTPAATLPYATVSDFTLAEKEKLGEVLYNFLYNHVKNGTGNIYTAPNGYQININDFNAWSQKSTAYVICNSCRINTPYVSGGMNCPEPGDMSVRYLDNSVSNIPPALIYILELQNNTTSQQGCQVGFTRCMDKFVSPDKQQCLDMKMYGMKKVDPITKAPSYDAAIANMDCNNLASNTLFAQLDLNNRLSIIRKTFDRLYPGDPITAANKADLFIANPVISSRFLTYTSPTRESVDQLLKYMLQYEKQQVCLLDCIASANSAFENWFRKKYDALSDNAIKNYYSQCYGGLREEIKVSYTEGPLYYTLYDYDKQGRLITTVPPEGVIYGGTVENLTSSPLKTSYTYDSDGSMVSQQSPDAGTTSFLYDDANRIRFSRNAQQGTNAFSYTIYEAKGNRITETGELVGGGYTQANANIATYPSSGTINDKINFTYDNPSYTFNYQNKIQTYLKGRVACMANASAKIHFSYDIHGRVNYIITELLDASLPAAMKYQLLEYNYQPISGLVTEVIFQQGIPGQEFRHRYSYDADKRLTNVQISTNGSSWQQAAAYSYYTHGPLRHTDLGTNIQRTNYAYNLLGWLKAINHPLDDYNPGKDGLPGTTTTYYKDVFSMVLNYFPGDFSRTGVGLDAGANVSLFGDATTDINNPNRGLPLYNGNIASIISNTAFNQTSASNVPNILGQRYGYDAVNRYVGNYTQTQSSTAVAGLTAWNKTATDGAFQEALTYDANGNIITLIRKDATGTAFDNLNYAYTPLVGGIKSTNKLTSLQDLAGDAPGIDDLISQLPDNYSYDAKGRMIADVSSKISQIQWNSADKVSAVLYTGHPSLNRIDFTYDPMNRRLSKKVSYLYSAPQTTYYSYDASGNAVATYQLTGTVAANYVCSENPIYGSKRLGEYKRNELLSATASQAANTAKMEFELTDHLGNVRAVVTGRQQQVVASAARVYEGFNYPQQPLNGLTTGLNGGWNGGPWYGSGFNVAGSRPLSNPAIPSSPTYAAGESTGYVYRDFRAILFPNNANSKVWYSSGSTANTTPNFFSFVIRKENNNQQAVYVGLGNDPNANIAVGYFGANSETNGQKFWTIRIRRVNSTFDYRQTTIPVVPGEAALLVLQIAGWSSGGYAGFNVSAWVNPTGVTPTAHWSSSLVTTGPGVPPEFTYREVAFTTFTLYSEGNNEGAIDEITMDLTYAAVTTRTSTGIANAEIVALTDYYPFGSEMPGRKFVADNYRYGFNGKEKDGETNDYDYGFRMYKPSIARFMSVDPLTNEYPFYSPYHFAGNSPIANVDVDGLEPASVVQYDKFNKAYIFTENAANLLSEITGIDVALIKKTKIRSHNSEYGMTFYQKIFLPASFFNGGKEDNEMSWLFLLSHEVGHLPQAQKIGNDATYVVWHIAHYIRSAILYDWQNPDSRIIHDASLPEQEAEQGRNKFNSWKKKFPSPYDEIKSRLGKSDKDARTPKSIPKDKPPKDSTHKKRKDKQDPYGRYKDGKKGGGIKDKHKSKK